MFPSFAHACTNMQHWSWEVWWYFFCPILEHFCPLVVQIAQMGLILPRWGLILPRIPPPTPVLYSVVTKPFRGYVRTRNTASPTQNTPFPGLILKVGKMNYCLGKMDPIWAKCLKSGQNFSRSGQKKFIHYGGWRTIGDHWSPQRLPVGT